MRTPPADETCFYCPHEPHARGEKCGAPLENGKRCKCKAGAHWWDSLGDAIGESLFGGGR